MQLLLPIGLLLLLALPLIVLLHLIRERRRRVVVPSLLNWRGLPRPRDGRRSRRLPLTLLLLLQLLIAALLALALARPQLLGGPQRSATQLAIVLDTSTSMAARDGVSTRFAQAQQRAIGLLRGLENDGRATIIVAGTTPRVLAAGSTADLVALEAAVSSLLPGGIAADLDGALALAEATFDPQLPGRIAVLTDGGAAPPAVRPMAAPVEWQQFGGNAPNRAILAFAARPSGGKTQVYARVANYGGVPFTGVLRLFADDQPVDARPVAVAPDAEAEQTWTLPAGARQLQLALDGGDALPDDDTAQISLATTRPLRVALVAAEPEPLRRALAAVPGVTVIHAPPANYLNDGEADVTVFDGTLPERWPDGAVLVINPPAGSQLLAVDGITAASGQLVQRGALLAGLSFGGVDFGSARLTTPPAWAATLLAAGDTPLVLRGRDGDHEVAVWAFDLREGNLSTRLAFPLLVARTIRDLAPTAPGASIQAGASLALRPSPRATSIELIAPDGVAQQISPAAVSVDTLTQPGWYDLIERGAAGELYRTLLAVNAGSPLESNLRMAAPPILSNVPDASSFAAPQTTDVWPWLALAVLVFLGAEWLYVHRSARKPTSS